MPREFRDLAHLGPLGFHNGGGWGPRAKNLPRASRDVNLALTCMQQPHDFIFQRLFRHEGLQITATLNACFCCQRNGLQQSQGNLVFRGREWTQKSYWLKS